jgi:hypothetical protein
MKGAGNRSNASDFGGGSSKLISSNSWRWIERPQEVADMAEQDLARFAD